MSGQLKCVMLLMHHCSRILLQFENEASIPCNMIHTPTLTPDPST